MVDNELIAVKMKGFSRIVKAGRKAKRQINNTAGHRSLGSHEILDGPAEGFL